MAHQCWQRSSHLVGFTTDVVGMIRPVNGVGGQFGREMLGIQVGRALGTLAGDHANDALGTMLCRGKNGEQATIRRQTSEAGPMMPWTVAVRVMRIRASPIKLSN